LTTVPFDFYLYLASRFFSASAGTLLRAALAWHVFELTHSPFHLGLIGIVQFVPQMVLLLVGGAVADSFDRRRVINASQLVLVGMGAALFMLTRDQALTLPILYVLAALQAAALSFEQPSRVALLPALVPRERFQRAVTISSTNQALAFATGPAIGGLIIAGFGIAQAYAAYLTLVTLAFFCVLMLRSGGSAKGTARSPVNLSSVREGISFVLKQPVILGCMTLDMFAVIFGGATALLPVYAKEILAVGPTGYGALTSSLEVGALAMATILMLRPTIVRAGRALLLAVGVFGIATIVFGLSRSFPISLVAYAVCGMADQVSVVMRSTAVQLQTPDALRGRVSAVSMLFIGASNQLGAAESGFVAAATTPTFAVVSGGVGCLLVLAVVAYLVPALRGYRIERAA
jgi:MFS family permease